MSPLFTRFSPAFLASAVVGLVLGMWPLPPTPRMIALVCLVGAWAAAVLLGKRDLRARATVVFAIGAVTAAGQVDGGFLYGIACAPFLVACVLSMRVSRAPVQFGEQRVVAPAFRVVLVFLLTSIAAAGGLIWGLPRLAERVERRINAMFDHGGEEATAFSTNMVLGSTRGILQSNAVVMRIEGGRVEYLRGAVYDRYEPPFWTTTPVGRAKRSVLTTTLDQAAEMRMTLARGTPNGDDMRWFLPLDACDFGLPSTTIDVDAFGVARRGRGPDPPVLTFRVGCTTRWRTVAAPPSENDLEVPDRVVKSLAPIAASWTAEATTPKAKLEAISRELGRFGYSLEVPRDVHLDPVVDFITVHRAGHCEMFASAMVLMARMEGIPARMVGGYRASEVNPLTGHTVVRDRNAHTWVEAWIDDAWTRWDPTPPTESFMRASSAGDYLADVLSTAFDRVVTSLTKLGPLGTAGVLVVVVGFSFGVRWISGRRRRGLQRVVGETPPMPCFTHLTAALAVIGHPRDESEPLEALANRLGALGTPWAHDVSRALLAYATLRYGGLGNEDDVARTVEDAARAVQSAALERSDAPSSDRRRRP